MATTREELDLYFAIRALAWNNKLATLDAKTVAAVKKALKSEEAAKAIGGEIAAAEAAPAEAPAEAAAAQEEKN